MFKFWIWLKTFKYELIAAFVDTFLVVISGIYRESIIVITASLATIVISFFVVLYFRSKDKEFYFLPLDKPGQENEWIGRGEWKYDRINKCFEITNSDVGFLFPKTLLWDDYSVEFDFKILKKTCAWIVRAQNLSNYIMLQCSDAGINPHIRLDGQWVVIDHSKVNLSFKTKLSSDEWYKTKITCDKRTLKIFISAEYGEIFDRQWTIPENLIWHIQEESVGGNTGKILNLIRVIDFDFGGIGFRNWGDEKALIKNVYIYKI